MFSLTLIHGLCKPAILLAVIIDGIVNPNDLWANMIANGKLNDSIIGKKNNFWSAQRNMTTEKKTQKKSEARLMNTNCMCLYVNQS